MSSNLNTSDAGAHNAGVSAVPLEHPLATTSATITLWQSIKAAEGTRRAQTWGEFFESLKKPRNCDVKRLLPAFSAATFADNRRKKSAAIEVCAGVLDYDHGTTIEKAVALWGGFYGFLHTSHSHTPEEHRFRVILPFTRAVTPTEYESIWLWMAMKARDAGHEIDQSTKDASRMWLLPGVRTGGEFRTEVLTGSPLNPDTILKEIPVTTTAPTREPHATALTNTAASVNTSEKTDPPQSAPGGAGSTDATSDVVVEGGRHNFLVKVAGGLRRKGNDERVIFAGISAANETKCIPPLPEQEVAQIARSMMRYPAGDFPLTDSGNAERLRSYYGDDFRWTPQLGWLVWEDGRWAIDHRERVQHLSKLVARRVGEETANAKEEGRVKALSRHAHACESRASRKAMVELVKAEPGVSTPIISFDTDPWLFNVANGTLDLRSNRLHAHRREDYITKLAPVVYIEGASAPVWTAFMEQIIPDEEVRAYLQRLAGYWLTGVVRDHVLPVFYGTGSNGKSTFVDTILAMMGDYARPFPSEELMVRRGEAHPTGRAMLRGLRFAPASETDQGRALSEAMVKQLTGGDRITARFMRMDYFDFPPTHKLALATNHKPLIRGTDKGIWRRIHLVFFGVTVPENKQDKALKEKLLAELSGIFRWALDGCRAWQHGGLAPPQAVLDATREYKAEMDVVGQYLEECCVEERANDAVRIGASELYDDYVRWSTNMGIHTLNQNNFGSAMTDHGFDRRLKQGRKFYVGLRLRDLEDKMSESKSEQGRADNV